MSDIVTSIITTLVAQAAIFGILAFLGKKFTTILSDRYLKGAEVKLKAKADGELERVKVELGRSTELYKAQLRKSEWVFEKEYAASSSLYSIVKMTLPRPSNPDPDWADDALSIMVEQAAVTEQRLRDYLNAHSPALTPEEIGCLEECVNSANDIDNHRGLVPDDEMQGIAEKLYDRMKEAHRALHERVRSQSAL